MYETEDMGSETELEMDMALDVPSVGTGLSRLSDRGARRLVDRGEVRKVRWRIVVSGRNTIGAIGDWSVSMGDRQAEVD